MLTGLERFVRLVVHRETLVPAGQGNNNNNNNTKASPRVFGAPRPYTGLYSAGSYMANRPSYTGYRRAQPGGRISGSSLPDTNHSTTGSPGASPSIATKQPQQMGGGVNTSTAPSNTAESFPTGTTQVSSNRPLTNDDFQAMIPQHFLQGKAREEATPGVHVTVNLPTEDTPMGMAFPPPPTKLGKVTESITKSTLTETVLTRITDNQLASVPLVVEVRWARLENNTLTYGRGLGQILSHLLMTSSNLPCLEGLPKYKCTILKFSSVIHKPSSLMFFMNVIHTVSSFLALT